MSVASGKTRTNATNWVNYSQHGIYIDVDTSWVGFTQTPVYITSLGGSTRHWTARGGSSVYKPTPTSFRVYVNYPNITPEKANNWGWHINWIAMAPFTEVDDTGEGSPSQQEQVEKEQHAKEEQQKS